MSLPPLSFLFYPLVVPSETTTRCEVHMSLPPLSFLFYPLVVPSETPSRLRAPVPSVNHSFSLVTLGI
jgi:hypothetical protein